MAVASAAVDDQGATRWSLDVSPTEGDTVISGTEAAGEDREERRRSWERQDWMLSVYCSMNGRTWSLTGAVSSPLSGSRMSSRTLSSESSGFEIR